MRIDAFGVIIKLIRDILNYLQRKIFLRVNGVLLTDAREEVGLLNSHIASNFSDRLIDPWADKLKTHASLPSPSKLIHHDFPQNSMAHCTFLCYSN